MRFMTTWTLLPGTVKTAALQFLAGGGGRKAVGPLAQCGLQRRVFALRIEQSGGDA